MQVNIPFKDRFKEVMLSGQKIMTSRTNCYGSLGDTFQAFGRTFEITSCRTMRLGYVANQYYREEGFDSREDFIEFWATIHPIAGYKQDQIVYVHEFKLAIEL